MTLINKDICKAVSEFEGRQIRNSRWPGYHGCHVFLIRQRIQLIEKSHTLCEDYMQFQANTECGIDSHILPCF